MSHTRQPRLGTGLALLAALVGFGHLLSCSDDNGPPTCSTPDCGMTTSGPGSGGSSGATTSSGSGKVGEAEHRWSAAYGEAQIFDIAADPSGNIVLVGYGPLNADFGGGLLSGGIFMAKLDADGNHIWSKSFIAGEARAFTVATDSQGNIWFAGSYTGNFNLQDGLTTPINEYRAFVAKLDPDGEHLFSRNIGNVYSGNNDDYDLAVGPGDVVAFVGRFQGNVDLGGGPLGGVEDSFLGVLTSTGEHVWSVVIGDLESTRQGANSVAFLDDDVVISGEFYVELSVAGGPKMEAEMDSDLFVARLDQTGKHVWSRSFENGLLSQLAVDPETNDILVSGMFSSTLEVGDTVLSGSKDVFLIRLDEDGAPLWARGYGDDAIDEVRALRIDEGGVAVLTGDYNIDLGFGGDPISSKGGRDIFLARIDAEGGHLSTDGFGSDGVESDRGVGIAVLDGDVFLAGEFGGEIDFGGGALSPPGVFVTRLGFE